MAEAKWRRYRRLTGPDLDADIREEIEFHLQVMTDRHVAAGMSPEAARARALTEFGDLAKARESCMDIGASRQRASRRAEVLGNLWQDVRHGARRLAKSPGFTVLTVLTLAIGLGPNIAIFNIINSVLLTPLPYREPDRLHAIYETFPMAGGTSGNGSVSGPNFVDWRASNQTFSDLSIATTTGANLGDAGEPERVTSAAVDARAFPMLGVSPIRGRLFRPDEAMPNGPKVVILSETFWRRKYAADEAIIGRRLTIDGAPHEVIGILPTRIIFPNRSAALDLWTPFQRDLSTGRGSHAYRVYGRLKPGVSPEMALADLRTVAARIERDYPREQEGRSVTMIPLVDTVLTSAKERLGILLGAAAIVLLIACANAASLMLARAASRRQEVAVLAALGATRGRVMQQFFVESLLVSAVASLLGVVLSVAAVKGILQSAGNMVPRTTEIGFDARTVIFVAGAILLTTIVCGIAPAIRATRTDLQSNLRETRTGGRAGAFRSGLVVTQFALSLVLLAGAGLLFRTFVALMETPTGMQTTRVMTMHLPVPLGGPRYTDGGVAIGSFHKPLLDRVRAMPGVEAAGIINRVPLQESGLNGNFGIIGKTFPDVGSQPFAEMRIVSPGYFATMGIPILRGRDVMESDDTTSPVVVINEEAARRYFSDGDPLGRHIHFGAPAADNQAIRVVGVVGSVRQTGIEQKPAPELYFPYRQGAGQMTNVALMVRATGRPESVVRPIQAAIRELDPMQPVYNVKSMRDVMSESVADRRLYLRLLGAFSAVALLLAMAGIYGVISYAVTQRTREFGIRIALGSGTGRIRRMVVSEGARLAAIGLAIGIPGAFLMTKVIASVLYGVDPADPVTYLSVALILTVISLVASYVPARRAVRVDPIIAMRAE